MPIVNKIAATVLIAGATALGGLSLGALRREFKDQSNEAYEARNPDRANDTAEEKIEDTARDAFRHAYVTNTSDETSAADSLDTFREKIEFLAIHLIGMMKAPAGLNPSAPLLWAQTISIFLKLLTMTQVFLMPLQILSASQPSAATTASLSIKTARVTLLGE